MEACALASCDGCSRESLVRMRSRGTPAMTSAECAGRGTATATGSCIGGRAAPGRAGGIIAWRSLVGRSIALDCEGADVGEICMTS